MTIPATKHLTAERSTDREHALQTLADNVPDVILRFDRTLRHVFVNAAVEQATGLRKEDFIGRTSCEVGLPDSLCTTLERAIGHAFETGACQICDFTLLVGGRARHFACRMVPERGPSGDIEHVLAVAHDVSARKLAEDQVRESERQLALALEAGELGFWDWNVPSGRMEYGGCSAKLLGYDEDDADRHLYPWHGLIHPDDQAAVGSALCDHLGGATELFESEHRLRCADGSWRWFLARGRVVERDANAGPVRVIGTIADVNARKDSEAELGRLYASLRAQEKRKDEFLATLAHELRNPLAPVRSGVEVLKRTSDPALAARTIPMIERQLSQMVRLIDDLMDVSRISSGKIVLQRERVRLQDVVDAAAEACRPVIAAARQTLVVEHGDEALWLDADAARLTQVVGNLLTNATKYTPEGGRIVLRALRDGSDGVVSVTDTGAGIPADMLARVFDLFTQVNRTVHRAQGGLGIGLSLVKRLVEMHGGTVLATSDGPGTGSTFTVRLPRLVEAERGEEPPPRPTQELPTGRRVLVVDDNVDAAEMLATMLELSGNEVRTATGGVEALELARGFRPEVVFLDIGMPDMNGYDVARCLRRERELCDAVLVAVTGWGTEDDRRKSRDAGFDHHLTKPVEGTLVTTLMATLCAPAGEARG